MDINLYIHSIEIEFPTNKRYVNANEEQEEKKEEVKEEEEKEEEREGKGKGDEEESIVYCLHIKVEDNVDEQNRQGKNVKFYETPWYMSIKKDNSEICMMSYEMNISYAFNLLEKYESLILYVLRKNLKNDKIEYVHRNELDIKDKKYYDNTNCIHFENDVIKGKIKLYLKNGIIYNHLLNKIKSDDFLNDAFLKKEQVPKMQLNENDENMIIRKENIEEEERYQNDFLQDKMIINDFKDLTKERRTLYWVYLDDNNNEQGPFNSYAILHWVMNEYFEDNTLIRLHDKKRFYKLYQVIEYIEKNVLLITQNGKVQYGEQLGLISEDGLHGNMNQKNERHLFNEAQKKNTENLENAQNERNFQSKGTIINDYVKNENDSENYFENVNGKEDKKRRSERDNQLVHAHESIDRICDGGNKNYDDKLGIKKNVSDKKDSKKEEQQNIDNRNHDFSKNTKNSKKKNQVKKLKKEIKKIKEEMIKLKEKSYREKCIIYDSMGKESYCSMSNGNRGVDQEEKKKYFNHSSIDIIENKLFCNTRNNICINGKENSSDDKHVKENLRKNDYYYNDEDGTNNKGNILRSYNEERRNSANNCTRTYDKENIQKVLNDINKEFKIKENFEKKKCIDIAMSSINQAQKCLLNIKKKKMTSYLNRIINLSFHDQAIYIRNDQTEFIDSTYMDKKKKKKKKKMEKREKGASCNCTKCIHNSGKGRSSYPFPNCIDPDSYILSSRGEQIDKRMYLMSNKGLFRDVLGVMPKKQKERDYIRVINCSSKFLGNNEKNKKKGKKVEDVKDVKEVKEQAKTTTTLCFNIRNNSSEFIYTYKVSHDMLMRRIIYLQYNVKKWLRKKRKRKKLCNACSHNYRNFTDKTQNGISSEKGVDEGEQDKKSKTKDALNTKRHTIAREYSLNSKNGIMYEERINILERKNGHKNEGKTSPKFSLLHNREKSKDVKFHSLTNIPYIFKKINDMNKYNEDKLTKKFRKKNFDDVFDNSLIHKYEYGKNDIPLKREDVEMIKELYGINCNEINTEHSHVNIKKKYNVYDPLHDVLIKYKKDENENIMNDNTADHKKNEPYVINLNKYNYLKLVDKNDIKDKKDIFLKIVNNLKFDNILNEKKKNCKLQINFKNNSIMPMENILHRIKEKSINRGNMVGGSRDSICAGISSSRHYNNINNNNSSSNNNNSSSNNNNSSRNNNSSNNNNSSSNNNNSNNHESHKDRINCKLTQIKLQNKDTFFCEIPDKNEEKLINYSSRKDHTNCFLLPNLKDNYLKKCYKEYVR
ncbi:conserved Plasmodium protein, unknown function [Plasmodium malariae]|uniref:GYF domain-containing protein n=1 Tax=Plasmodium malariae TaxID=5858 RepID=A0A1D3TE64_PLAMA|nr:conserved Plasmodium protein, unknown function [Plasmodium malariae]SCP03234.1 conserved Plasmodium protein, unknown function [Plasmodium malariae]